MASVLLSPLNWGLGHAMRDIPIIRTLIEHDHDVTIAACGNALASLKKECAGCRFIDLPDYPSPYSSGRFFLPKFSLYFPIMLRAIAMERKNIGDILAKDDYDLIVSDSRPGVYSDHIPSLFITHQLHYHLPLGLWPFELLALRLNDLLFRKFERVIVPDNPQGPASLAGKLSRPGSNLTSESAFYSGILTSTRMKESRQDLDYLVIISGPEPQRTRLEEILLPRVCDLPGSTAVILGSPARKSFNETSGSCSIHGYVSNEEKEDLMNRAKFVICRSGYTSMMDLAELNKRHALLIPTPGQTEQEYLSGYYAGKGWFLSKSQYHLNLDNDITTAMTYTGFPEMPKTAGNSQNLYNNLFANYLE
jgi:hypothetical protein